MDKASACSHAARDYGKKARKISCGVPIVPLGKVYRKEKARRVCGLLRGKCLPDGIHLPDGIMYDGV